MSQISSNSSSVQFGGIFSSTSSKGFTKVKGAFGKVTPDAFKGEKSPKARLARSSEDAGMHMFLTKLGFKFDDDNKLIWPGTAKGTAAIVGSSVALKVVDKAGDRIVAVAAEPTKKLGQKAVSGAKTVWAKTGTLLGDARAKVFKGKGQQPAKEAVLA